MSGEDLIYKTGTASENDICLHLNSCNDSFVPPLNTRISINDYSKKISDNAITFEAWDHKKLAGLIATYFNKENNFGFITNVSVMKEYMGSGIASKLLKMCLNYATNNQYAEIKLEVFKDNIPALNFYKKYNFTHTGIKDDYILMKHNLIHK